MTGDDVSRRTWVPSALIDQISFVSSEKTTLPFRDRMSIGWADEAWAEGVILDGEPALLEL